MSTEITQNRTVEAQDRNKRVALTLAGLALLGGTFFLGRRTAGPRSPQPAPEQSAGQTAEGGKGKASDEKGVIKFEEESLKLAGLKVESVALQALQGRLAVTGTVEPNLGGVVKVTPRVAGKVTTVLVNVGDNVRQGQALATLASTELAQAQAVYRQAGSRVVVAASNLVRQRKLAGLGEFGRHKVEEARGTDVTAQGEINTTLNELAAARNEVTEARSERAAFEGEVAGAQSEVVSAESEAASAESEITEAQGQVKSLQAALVQAQTQVKVSQSKFNRLDILLKEQLASKQDWEQAQADHQRALSDVDAAQANVSQGQAKVETARSHLRAAQAKVKAAQAQVRAAQGRAEQAAAKIESASSRQQQVESKLAAARKRAEIASQSLSREEKVYKGGFLTSKEIVEAEATLQQARAEQRAAADNIRLMGGTPGGGNQLTIAAPLGGRLTERTVTLGETVTPEKALFTVVNLNSVWVQLNVYQKDLPAVRLGQPVSLTTDAAPGRTFSGVVSYLGDTVDETTRTVKVRAVIQNPRNVLKPQTFVRGKIAAAVLTQALAVPKDAVQEMDGKPVVFVAGDHPGEFRAKEVHPGDTINEQTVLTSGLEAGDQVVTVGAFLVKAQAMKSELSEE